MSAQSGDNTAAFRLGRALTVCHETMRQVPNAATLDQILHVMRTAEPAQALAFERLNDACSRHQALTAAGIDWVTAAAEAGHAEAQLWYLPTAETYYEPATDEIRSWYRAKGIELWQAARDAGNLQATLNLSDWYRDIDPVAAVAHVELAERLMRRSADDMLALEPYLAPRRILMSRLSEAQLAEAMARADAMYERCCR